MSFEIKGLKEAKDRLKKLSNDAGKIDGQTVPLTDVMTDSFVERSRYAAEPNHHS